LLRKLRLALCAALFWALAANTLYFAWQAPLKNWDVMNYIGAAKLWDVRDRDQWYEQTMTEIARSCPPIMFNKMNKLRNPESFHQVMPFFTVKPLYVGMIWTLDKLGAPMGDAIYAISLASLLALALLLFFARPTPMDWGTWWLLAGVFLFYWPVPATHLARLGTPDMLSIFMTTLCAYALFVWRRHILWLVPAVLALLVRPDTLPMLLLLAGAAVRAGLMVWRKAALSALLLAAMFVAILHAVGFYGWLVFLEHHLLLKRAYPAELQGDITLGQYLDFAGGTLWQAVFSAGMIWMLCWSALAAGAHSAVSGRMSAAAWLLAVAWLSLAAKMVMVNDWDERFYYGSFLLCFISGTMLIADAIRNRRSGHADAS
jgi:hypothetical protein